MSPRWTQSDDEVLRAAYAENPARGAWLAKQRLPHRTHAAIWLRASHIGLAKKRPPKDDLLASAPAIPTLRYPEPPKLRYLPGPLDLGERELLRKQLLYFAGTVSNTTRRSPAAVLEAVREIAKAHFRPTERFTINVDPGACYGTLSENAVRKDVRRPLVIRPRG